MLILQMSKLINADGDDTKADQSPSCQCCLSGGWPWRGCCQAGQALQQRAQALPEDNILCNVLYRVSKRSVFKNAEAQKSQPKISVLGPIFPMDMRLILLSLSNKQPKKMSRHSTGVTATGD